MGSKKVATKKVIKKVAKKSLAPVVKKAPPIKVVKVQSVKKLLKTVKMLNANEALFLETIDGVTAELAFERACRKELQVVIQRLRGQVEVAQERLFSANEEIIVLQADENISFEKEMDRQMEDVEKLASGPVVH